MRAGLQLISTQVTISRMCAVKFPEVARDYAKALALIDTVHSDGDLRYQSDDGRWGKIYACEQVYTIGYLGECRLTPKGVPWYVGVRPAASPRLFIMLHEFGHVVEYATTRAALYKYDSADKLTRLRMLLKTTGAGQRLQNILRIATALSTQEQVDILQSILGGERQKDAIRKIPLSSYIQYLILDGEMFARAYAQWVSMKTGDPAALAGLQIYLDPDRNGKCPEQWTETEFPPIAEAFDNLYTELGWLI